MYFRQRGTFFASNKNAGDKQHCFRFISISTMSKLKYSALYFRKQPLYNELGTLLKCSVWNRQEQNEMGV